RDDNSYHHFWELEAPLSRTVRTVTSLRMYKRDAEFERRPVTVRDIYARHRHDRDLETRFEFAPDSLRTLSLTLFHRRNESAFEQSFSYRRTLDHLANGAELAYDRAAHGLALRLAARGARHKFRINSAANWRNTGALSARALLHNSADSAAATRLAFAQAGLDYTGGYDPLPRAAVGIISQNANKRIALSAGVTPLFPRQYELDLPFEIISTGAGLAALSQSGAPSLRPERQYTGALEAWFGDTRKSIALVATGGLIANGINWRESADQTGQRFFRPLNEDFTYASAQLNARLTLTNWLAARGSAAVYSVDYDSTANPPYTPDYNLFAALEAQRYFDVVGVDLSGYAEVSFPGSYYGYNGLLYGQQAIVNASATARIKSFAFHFVFEDALNTQYFAREEYFYIGRYTWYWVTWDFLN
ncbi:MAG TPA: hypothetical protein VLB27_06600, partial [candidate division Zixibacteria bacterium]|nr:hypothetical protein [candidate division Zixibacteria bacterium]